MKSNVNEGFTGSLCEEDEEHLDTAKLFAQNIIPEERKLQIVWRNVVIFAFLHLAALYGVSLFCKSPKISTIIFGISLGFLSSMGITAGAHRLWTHRSYKAKWPLRVFLMMCHTIALQNSLIEWVRDHRVHHKYVETDADPHNAKRGFFFAHIGWLLVRKHPDVKLKGKTLDLSDLYVDPMLRFQERHYSILAVLMCLIMPAVVPWYFWDETLHKAFFLCSILRLCIVLNITWLINLGAHTWGQRPYDRYICATDHILVALATMGAGWHNFHHSFPWDYKSEELGRWSFSPTTMFVDVCASLGLAYDLKTVSADVVKRRVLRTGDGSHAVWGWGDKDQLQQERDEALIY